MPDSHRSALPGTVVFTVWAVVVMTATAVADTSHDGPVGDDPAISGNVSGTALPVAAVRAYTTRTAVGVPDPATNALVDAFHQPQVTVTVGRTFDPTFAGALEIPATADE